jgi:hypothetical protein
VWKHGLQIVFIQLKVDDTFMESKSYNGTIKKLYAGISVDAATVAIFFSPLFPPALLASPSNKSRMSCIAWRIPSPNRFESFLMKKYEKPKEKQNSYRFGRWFIWWNMEEDKIFRGNYVTNTITIFGYL